MQGKSLRFRVCDIQIMPSASALFEKMQQKEKNVEASMDQERFLPPNATEILTSKKKGLSADEKRKRMMEFFYEQKDFFQLKELERLCQKEKGITSMSVKEILTSLVDDGMVDTEKIGTSVYFWAFPSKASQNRKRKLADLTEKLNELESKKKSLTDAKMKAIIGKEETDARTELMVELSRKQEEKATLLAEIARYKECDPEVIEQVKTESQTAKEAANRWTDNVFSIKSWIKTRFAFEEEVIDKQFEIPADFDYLE